MSRCLEIRLLNIDSIFKIFYAPCFFVLDEVVLKYKLQVMCFELIF